MWGSVWKALTLPRPQILTVEDWNKVLYNGMAYVILAALTHRLHDLWQLQSSFNLPAILVEGLN